VIWPLAACFCSALNQRFKVLIWTPMLWETNSSDWDCGGSNCAIALLWTALLYLPMSFFHFRPQDYQERRQLVWHRGKWITMKAL
jgi:hypothetical protein